MEMVGHEDISVNQTAMLFTSSQQTPEEEVKVQRSQKDRRPIVAPLDDVLRLSGNHVAGQASHRP
jgi:hypothetical protein